MRLLLDTHALLWLLADDPRLKPALPTLRQADEIHVSAASWWELAIKIGMGRLQYDLPALRQAAADSGLLELPVSGQHTEALLHLPPHHRDPFDRLLVAQALTEPMRLLTHDEQVARYTELAIRF